jgi:mono/diheme cytochrome c family protein
VTRFGWLLALLLAMACNPGPYPTDIYPEMHYSAAYRRGEPTRRSPGAEAVPVSGRAPRWTFDQATSQPNPVTTLPAGATELYRVNCSMCHGADGHGHSVVADAFATAGAVAPVDLASPRVRERTDGQLWWIVANGLGNMPAFGNLLSEQELWMLVRFMREVQQR